MYLEFSQQVRDEKLRTTVIVLPIGYGKSLCFACLPWLFDKLDNTNEPSIVIVICPLTAIMLDQVNQSTFMVP